jgi:hypothetical protein
VRQRASDSRKASSARLTLDGNGDLRRDESERLFILRAQAGGLTS